jgi:pimeloyl-ACP methyl ester carboxylesterase
MNGTVTSADGTTIAYETKGDGPAVLLVQGALGFRAWDPLTGAVADQLAASGFTTLYYDRRGRGESGDTPPYAVQREIEDIAALLAAAGGTAHVYGLSSGAILALRAAAELPGLTRVVTYEPPFIVDDSRPPLPDDYVEQLDRAVAEGRRGDAVTIFMTRAVGVPEEYLGGMRADPSWTTMESVAHTLAYDGRVCGTTMSGKPLPTELARVTVPVLAVAGGNSEAFMRDGSRALADLLPHADYVELPGQDHAVAADALVPVIVPFLRG